MSYPAAIKLILEHEGGYVNDPDDRGGATNFGIIQTTYDSYRKNKELPLQSVKEIEQDEVQEIYYKNYWLDALCDRLPFNLAIVHFDFAVNSGISQAIRTLQRVLKVTVDGQFGPKSFEALGTAIRDRGVDALVDAYSSERVAFYITITENRPTNLKFLRGWYKRTCKTRDFAKSYFPTSDGTVKA
jgi:lysozyme family protein